MNQGLEAYYRFHAGIYDLTRWSFLFGRGEVIRRIAILGEPRRILEVGCGTGKNLVKLAKTFPTARITGLDLSPDMLRKAQDKTHAAADRIELVHRAYDGPTAAGTFDLILFSYSLSMMDPGWETALGAARDDLRPGGRIGVVDFHDSPFSGFRSWMGMNHVRMEGHLLPALQRAFDTETFTLRGGYGGLWRYLVFIGVNRVRPAAAKAAR